MWRKTIKKLDKAKAQDLRSALEALDAETQEMETTVSDLESRREAADLARATGEEGEDPSKLHSTLEEKRSTLRGFQAARSKLETALAQAEKVERDERKKALQQEHTDLKAQRDEEYKKGMKALTQAMLHFYNIHGGYYGHPSLVTGLSHWDISRSPVYKEERDRLRDQAASLCIDTRLRQIKEKIREG